MGRGRIGFTDAQLLDALIQGGSQRKAAEILGTKRNGGFINRCQRVSAKRGYSPEHGYNHPVPDGFTAKGVSTLYNADGEITAQWVKSTADKERQAEIFQETARAFAGELPRLPRIVQKGRTDADHHAVYDHSDAHNGLLAWKPETGQDWDVSIAIDTYLPVIDDVVSRAPATETATLIFGGDHFHYDNIFGTTARSGNVLDFDGRFPKMIGAGITTGRYHIERCLEKHNTVRLIVQAGNHDDFSGHMMRECFKQVYRDNKRLIVDESPSPYVYFTFGTTLFGTTHGHLCKLADLPSIMATDEPELWGKAKHRVFYSHHVHHERVVEMRGCTVITKNTLVPKDAWHHGAGYRAKQQMDCMVFAKKGGCVGTVVSNPELAGVQ